MTLKGHSRLLIMSIPNILPEVLSPACQQQLSVVGQKVWCLQGLGAIDEECIKDDTHCGVELHVQQISVCWVWSHRGTIVRYRVAQARWMDSMSISFPTADDQLHNKLFLFVQVVLFFCTSMKSTVPGRVYLFLLMTVWTYLHSIYTASSRRKWDLVSRCVTVVQDHSKSQELVPAESPYILLPISLHCNYMAIFYCFCSVTIYWSKIYGFSPFYPSQSLSLVWSPHSGRSPSTQQLLSC